MDKQQLLSQISIFSRLTPVELDAIVETCEDREYKAGEIIFEENSLGSEMYVLKTGSIAIDLSLATKRDAVSIHRVTPGGILGEFALLDEGSRSATARCESDCEVVAIHRERLFKLFEKNTRIGYVVMKNLATVLAGRIRNTNLQLVASLLSERGSWY